MARTMADRLDQERARTFVGREQECARFAELIGAAGEAALVVVHGPAGVGKSTLLRRFAAYAVDQDARCLLIDARDLPPTLEALGVRLAPVLDADPGPSPSPSPKTVVLIDAYELLADLDAGLRDQLAPRLPADSVLVLAGQQPASVGWRSDAGWSPLLHHMRLDNLSREDCGRYLAARGVPVEVRASAISFTHGHPLALALVSEVVRQKGALAPSDSADVVRVLIDRLLDEVPSAAHRAALEAAAEVRVINEPILGAMLESERGDRDLRLDAGAALRRGRAVRPVPARSGPRGAGGRPALARRRTACPVPRPGPPALPGPVGERRPVRPGCRPARPDVPAP